MSYHFSAYQWVDMNGSVSWWLNSSPPGKNGRHLTDDSFNRIFLNENIIISSQFSLQVGPKGPIDNKSACGSGNGLALNRRQAITLTNADPVHWRILCGARGSWVLKVF